MWMSLDDPDLLIPASERRLILEVMEMMISAECAMGDKKKKRHSGRHTVHCGTWKQQFRTQAALQVCDHMIAYVTIALPRPTCAPGPFSVPHHARGESDSALARQVA
jgi:hypothetical protein